MTRSDSSLVSDQCNAEILDGSQYAIEADATRKEFLATARVYAREVADLFDLHANVTELDWEVSTQAKRRAGSVTYRDGDPQTVTLAWNQFEQRGWTATAATIRHELIHVHLLNEGIGAGHGEEFERLAHELETPVHCERFTEPEWWVICQDCPNRIARYRRSKLVRKPEQYQCGDCGGSLLTEWNE